LRRSQRQRPAEDEKFGSLHGDAEGGVALDPNPRGVMPHGVAADTARDANAEVVRDPDDVVLWVSERADGDEENTSGKRE